MERIRVHHSPRYQTASRRNSFQDTFATAASRAQIIPRAAAARRSLTSKKRAAFCKAQIASQSENLGSDGEAPRPRLPQVSAPAPGRRQTHRQMRA